MLVSLKFVWSLGWDPGHHEELQNGPEVKFDIWKVIFRVSGKVREFFPVFVSEDSEGFWGSTEWGPTCPEGPHGL